MILIVITISVVASIFFFVGMRIETWKSSQIIQEIAELLILHDEATDSVGDAIGRIETKLDAVVKSNESANVQLEVAVRATIDPPVVKGAARVYGAILVNANKEESLYMCPANSIEDFTVLGKSLMGDDWTAKVINFVDVWRPKKEVVRVPMVPSKKEIKKDNLDNFVQKLEFARDSFTDTEVQKKTLEKIISNVKAKYESTN